VPVGVQWFTAPVNLIQSKVQLEMENEQRFDVDRVRERAEWYVLRGVRRLGVAVLMWGCWR